MNTRQLGLPLRRLLTGFVVITAACGGGDGGADMAPAQPDLLDPEPSCQPTTDCQTAGQECGPLDDGCHILDCGTCAAPLTCGGGGTGGVCGCTPKGCRANLDCGMMPDGCGGMLNCGGCSGTNSCGGGGTANQCGCTPSTTTCDGIECGSVTNNCGTSVSCGSCAATAVCGAQVAHMCGTGKQIFATSATFPATVGGLAQADAACALAARPAGLSANWKAWLSADGANAYDRITDVGPWYLRGTGALVFANKTQLGMFPSAPIDHDEYGAAIMPHQLAWTGTALGGVLTPWTDPDCQEYCDWTCDNWTQDASIRPNFVATVGQLMAVDKGWTSYGADDCDGGRNHLICIEQ